jgi:hypothetical protein
MRSHQRMSRSLILACTFAYAYASMHGLCTPARVASISGEDALAHFRGFVSARLVCAHGRMRGMRMIICARACVWARVFVSLLAFKRTGAYGHTRSLDHAQSLPRRIHTVARAQGRCHSLRIWCQHVRCLCVRVCVCACVCPCMYGYAHTRNNAHIRAYPRQRPQTHMRANVRKHICACARIHDVLASAHTRTRAFNEAMPTLA